MLTMEAIEAKIDDLKATIFNEIETVFRQYSEQFLEQIRTKQLEEKGVDGYNVKLRMPYSEQWKKTREKHGLPTDRRTLKFTGNFYKSMTIEFTNEAMIIDTQGVNYSDYLIGDNGINILRPNAEFIYKIMTMEVLPKVKQSILTR